jgi:hypothetical protein
VEGSLVKEEVFCSEFSFDFVTKRVPKNNLKRQNYNHSKKVTHWGTNPPDYNLVLYTLFLLKFKRIIFTSVYN